MEGGRGQGRDGLETGGTREKEMEARDKERTGKAGTGDRDGGRGETVDRDREMRDRGHGRNRGHEGRDGGEGEEEGNGDEGQGKDSGERQGDVGQKQSDGDRRQGKGGFG